MTYKKKAYSRVVGEKLRAVFADLEEWMKDTSFQKGLTKKMQGKLNCLQARKIATSMGFRAPGDLGVTDLIYKLVEYLNIGDGMYRVKLASKQYYSTDLGFFRNAMKIEVPSLDNRDDPNTFGYNPDVAMDEADLNARYVSDVQDFVVDMLRELSKNAEGDWLKKHPANKTKKCSEPIYKGAGKRPYMTGKVFGRGSGQTGCAVGYNLSDNLGTNPALEKHIQMAKDHQPLGFVPDEIEHCCFDPAFNSLMLGPTEDRPENSDYNKALLASTGGVERDIRELAGFGKQSNGKALELMAWVRLTLTEIQKQTWKDLVVQFGDLFDTYDVDRCDDEIFMKELEKQASFGSVVFGKWSEGLLAKGVNLVGYMLKLAAVAIGNLMATMMEAMYKLGAALMPGAWTLAKTFASFCVFHPKMCRAILILLKQQRQRFCSWLGEYLVEQNWVSVIPRNYKYYVPGEVSVAALASKARRVHQLLVDSGAVTPSRLAHGFVKSGVVKTVSKNSAKYVAKVATKTLESIPIFGGFASGVIEVVGDVVSDSVAESVQKVITAKMYWDDFEHQFRMLMSLINPAACITRMPEVRWAIRRRMNIDVNDLVFENDDLDDVLKTAEEVQTIQESTRRREEATQRFVQAVDNKRSYEKPPDVCRDKDNKTIKPINKLEFLEGVDNKRSYVRKESKEVCEDISTIATSNQESVRPIGQNSSLYSVGTPKDVYNFDTGIKKDPKSVNPGVNNTPVDMETMLDEAPFTRLP